MKILVCYESSEDNGTVIEKAKERAKESGATIYLLSVMIGSDVGQLKNVESAKKELEAAQASFKADKLPCETKLIFGGMAAGESIVEYAKEINSDEIIIGVKRKSKVGKLIFGSTAQHVILEAHCPVLTVK